MTSTLSPDVGPPRRRPGLAREVGGWRVLADAAAGTRKGPDGRCQDAFAVAVVPSAVGWVLVAACADGAGSVPHAELGAVLASRHGRDGLRRLVRRLPVGRTPQGQEAMVVFQEVRATLLAQAAAMAVPVRDLATTLHLVAAAPGWTLCAQIGDGAIVVRPLAPEGGLLLALQPDRGEYANMTRFVTDEALAVQAVVLPPAAAVAVLTDGLSPLALHHPGVVVHEGAPLAAMSDEPPTLPPLAAYLPFFTGLFAELARAAPVTLQRPFHAFLTSPAVQARTDDDVSLVLAMRTDAARLRQ